MEADAGRLRCGSGGHAVSFQLGIPIFSQSKQADCNDTGLALKPCPSLPLWAVELHRPLLEERKRNPGNETGHMVDAP